MILQEFEALRVKLSWRKVTPTVGTNAPWHQATHPTFVLIVVIVVEPHQPLDRHQNGVTRNTRVLVIHLHLEDRTEPKSEVSLEIAQVVVFPITKYSFAATYGLHSIHVFGGPFCPKPL